MSKGADVASATALPVLTDGNYFDVTGTTTITSINTTKVGNVIKLHFDGILTLTHHATDLILPSGANITTASGDEAEFVEYATGDYRCTNYMKASGEAVVTSVSGQLPVGSIYMNKAVATNPSTLLGYGTWVAIEDKFLVGRGSTYTATGGAATVTLSEANLPSHTHNLASNAGTGVAVSDIGTGTSVSGGDLSSPGGNTKATLKTTAIGSGTSFSIIPSYQAIYTWERTA